MKRFGITRAGLRQLLLSKSALALTLILLALGLAAVAIAVALAVLPRPGWAPLPQVADTSSERTQTAAVVVSALGVMAAVLAIVAAYVELRILFPRQKLRARLGRGPIDSFTDTSWVTFTNERDSALINAYRLEVWLEDEAGQTAGEGGGGTTGGVYTWREWEREMQADELSFFPHHWVLLRDEPFFPGTSVMSPYVVGVEKPRKWHAVWQTDRAGSDEALTLDVPPTVPDRRTEGTEC